MLCLAFISESDHIAATDTLYSMMCRKSGRSFTPTQTNYFLSEKLQLDPYLAFRHTHMLCLSRLFHLLPVAAQGLQICN